MHRSDQGNLGTSPNQPGLEHSVRSPPNAETSHVPRVSNFRTQVYQQLHDIWRTLPIQIHSQASFQIIPNHNAYESYNVMIVNNIRVSACQCSVYLYSSGVPATTQHPLFRIFTASHSKFRALKTPYRIHLSTKSKQPNSLFLPRRYIRKASLSTQYIPTMSGNPSATPPPTPGGPKPVMPGPYGNGAGSGPHRDYPSEAVEPKMKAPVPPKPPPFAPPFGNPNSKPKQ